MEHATTNRSEADPAETGPESGEGAPAIDELDRSLSEMTSRLLDGTDDEDDLDGDFGDPTAAAPPAAPGDAEGSLGEDDVLTGADVAAETEAVMRAVSDTLESAGAALDSEEAEAAEVDAADEAPVVEDAAESEPASESMSGVAAETPGDLDAAAPEAEADGAAQAVVEESAVGAVAEEAPVEDAAPEAAEVEGAAEDAGAVADAAPEAEPQAGDEVATEPVSGEAAEEGEAAISAAAPAARTIEEVDAALSAGVDAAEREAASEPEPAEVADAADEAPVVEDAPVNETGSAPEATVDAGAEPAASGVEAGDAEPEEAGAPEAAPAATAAEVGAKPAGTVSAGAMSKQSASGSKRAAAAGWSLRVRAWGEAAGEALLPLARPIAARYRSQPRVVRHSLGWLAIVTAFNAVWIWSYVLFLRGSGPAEVSAGAPRVVSPGEGGDEGAGGGGPGLARED